LFNYEFEPCDMKQFFCADCDREVHRLYEIDEEWWEPLLRSLKPDRKIGTDSDGSFSETFSAQTHWDEEGSSINSKEESKIEVLEDLQKKLLCWKCEAMEEVRSSGYLRGSDETGRREGPG
jgi:hypothetical protein